MTNVGEDSVMNPTSGTAEEVEIGEGTYNHITNPMNYNDYGVLLGGTDGDDGTELYTPVRGASDTMGIRTGEGRVWLRDLSAGKARFLYEIQELEQAEYKNGNEIVVQKVGKADDLIYDDSVLYLRLKMSDNRNGTISVEHSYFHDAACTDPLLVNGRKPRVLVHSDTGEIATDGTEESQGLMYIDTAYFENTRTVDIPIMKEWVGGAAVEDVTLRLKRALINLEDADVKAILDNNGGLNDDAVRSLVSSGKTSWRMIGLNTVIPRGDFLNADGTAKNNTTVLGGITLSQGSEDQTVSSMLYANNNLIEGFNKELPMYVRLGGIDYRAVYMLEEDATSEAYQTSYASIQTDESGRPTDEGARKEGDNIFVDSGILVVRNTLSATNIAQISAVKQLIGRNWNDQDLFEFQLEPVGRAAYFTAAEAEEWNDDHPGSANVKKPGDLKMETGSDGQLRVVYETKNGATDKTLVPMPVSGIPVTVSDGTTLQNRTPDDAGAFAALSTDTVAEGEHVARFGSITFHVQDLVYNETTKHHQGDFYYRLTEKKPSDDSDKKGITFSEVEHTIHIRVTENRTNELLVQVIYDQKDVENNNSGTAFSPVFTNYYNTAGSAEAAIWKQKLGGNQDENSTWKKENKYDFTLQPLSGAPLKPAAGDDRLVSGASDLADGKTWYDEANDRLQLRLKVPEKQDGISGESALLRRFVPLTYDQEDLLLTVSANNTRQEDGQNVVSDLNAVKYSDGTRVREGVRYGRFLYAIREMEETSSEQIRYDSDTEYVRITVIDKEDGTMDTVVEYFQDRFCTVRRVDEDQGNPTSAAYHGNAAPFTNLALHSIWVQKDWEGVPSENVTIRLERAAIADGETYGLVYDVSSAEPGNAGEGYKYLKIQTGIDDEKEPVYSWCRVAENFDAGEPDGEAQMTLVSVGSGDSAKQYLVKENAWQKVAEDIFTVDEFALQDKVKHEITGMPGRETTTAVRNNNEGYLVTSTYVYRVVEEASVSNGFTTTYPHQVTGGRSSENEYGTQDKPLEVDNDSTYTADGSASVNVVKQLLGRDWVARQTGAEGTTGDDFTFTIEPVGLGRYYGTAEEVQAANAARLQTLKEADPSVTELPETLKVRVGDLIVGAEAVNDGDSWTLQDVLLETAVDSGDSAKAAVSQTLPSGQVGHAHTGTSKVSENEYNVVFNSLNFSDLKASGEGTVLSRDPATGTFRADYIYRIIENIPAGAKGLKLLTEAAEGTQTPGAGKEFVTIDGIRYEVTAGGNVRVIQGSVYEVSPVSFDEVKRGLYEKWLDENTGLVYTSEAHLVRVRVVNVGSGRVTTQVSYDGREAGSFVPVYTNYYSAMCTLSTEVYKTIDEAQAVTEETSIWNKLTQDQDFAFELRTMSAAPMPGNTSADGVSTAVIGKEDPFVEGSSKTKKKTFGPITFTENNLYATDTTGAVTGKRGERYGMFFYAMSERIPEENGNGRVQNLAYDDTPVYVLVMVQDEGNGKLKATPYFYDSLSGLSRGVAGALQGSDAKAEFVNVQSIDIPVTKTWDGAAVTDSTVRLEQSEMDPASSGFNPDTAWQDAGRRLTFAKSEFYNSDGTTQNTDSVQKSFTDVPAYKNGKQLYFRIVEEAPQAGNGFTVTYSNNVFTAGNTEPLAVTNKYTADGTTIVSAVKQLLGRDWKGTDEFNFVLRPTGKGLYSLGEDQKLVLTVSDTEEAVKTVPLPGRKSGSAKTSDHISDTDKGIPASTKDESDDVAEDEHLATFARIRFDQSMLSMNPETGYLQGDFFYSMTEDIPANAVGYNKTTGVAVSGNNGEPLKYAAAADEQKQGLTWKQDGVTYDGNAYPVHIRVTDHLTGQLTAQVYYREGTQGDVTTGKRFTPVYINRYEAAGTILIPVTKHINSRAWTDADDFNFILTPLSGSPMPKDENGNTKQSLTLQLKKQSTDASAQTHEEYMNSDETGHFEVIPVSAAGEYVYQINEEKGEIAHLSYASEPVYVKVTVADNQQGSFEAVNTEFFSNAACTLKIMKKNSDGTDTTEAADTAFFTNTVVRDIEVVKEWKGAPVSDVTITLQRNEGTQESPEWKEAGTFTVPQSAAGNALAKTFPDLPAYDEAGREIEYRVVETAGTDYTTNAALGQSGDGGLTVPNMSTQDASGKVTVTVVNRNTSKRSITGTKIWVDGNDAQKKRPAKDTLNNNLHLYRSSSRISAQEVVIDGTEIVLSWDEANADADSNTEVYTISGLPVYDEEGNPFTYWVKEDQVTGYELAVYKDADGQIPTNSSGAELGAPNGGSITNTLTQEMISIPVTKKWVHNNNTDLPESITLNLMSGVDAGKKLERKKIKQRGDADTIWSYSFNNVPKYDDAREVISYTVEEDMVPGYVPAYEKDTENGGWIITNTYSAVVLPAEALKARKAFSSESETWEWGDNDQFAFALVAGDSSTPMPEGSVLELGERYKEITIGKTSEDHTGTFGAIQYVNAGEYHYFMRELTPAEGNVSQIPGMTYTTQRYRVTVKVEGDNSGNLRIAELKLDKVTGDAAPFIYEQVSVVTISADQQVGSVTAEFRNTYHKDRVSYLMAAEKSFNDRSEDTDDDAWTLNDVNGAFTFTMRPVGENAAAAPMPANIYDSRTGIGLTGEGTNRIYFTRNARNSVKFERSEADALTFTPNHIPENAATTTYTYELAEVIPDGALYMGDGYWRDMTTDIVYDGVRHYRSLTVSKTDSGVLQVESSTEHTDRYLDPAIGTEYADAAGRLTQENWEGELKKYEYSSADNSRHVNGVPNFLNHRDPLMDVTVNKVWDDADNQDGKRPVSITVRLRRKDRQPVLDALGRDVTGYNGEMLVHTLGGSNGGSLSYTWNHLPRYERVHNTSTNKDEIKEIIYEVIETAGSDLTEPSVPEGYTEANSGVSEVTASGDKGTATITNVHIPQTVNITATKEWDDADNEDGYRPTSLELYLEKKVGSEETTVPVELPMRTVTEAGNWTAVWNGLPVYENGQRITYTVWEQTSGAGKLYAAKHDGTSVLYTAENNGRALVAETGSGDVLTGTAKLKNKYTPKTVEFTAVKVWDDDDNRDGRRPESITLRLYRQVEGSSSEPAPVYEGEASASGDKVITRSMDGAELVVRWTGLPAYESGKKITYSVKEFAGTGTSAQGVDAAGRLGDTPYLCHITKSGEYAATVTNSYAPQRGFLKINKTWEDDHNADETRKSARIFLYQTVTNRDGTTTVSAAGYRDLDVTQDSQEIVFNDLPVYANGYLIRYSVDETSLDGYRIIYENAVGQTLENSTQQNPAVVRVTNKLFDTVSVPVTKVWADNSNSFRTRPDSITLQLRVDDKPVTEHILTEDNVVTDQNDQWAYTFIKMPKYRSDNTEITYTVREVNADPGYVPTYDQNESNGSWTVTNTLKTTELTVTKQWYDSRASHTFDEAKVLLKLYVNGTAAAGGFAQVAPTPAEVTLPDGGTATGKSFILRWSGLPLIDPDTGLPFIYSVLENVPDGYQAAYLNDRGKVTAEPAYDGYTIANIANVRVTVNKRWEDDNNSDGKRPASIHVDLLANETVKNAVTMKPDQEGSWTYTWDQLPYADVNAEGIPFINYTVNEVVPDGYTMQTEGEWLSEGVYQITLTNSHKRDDLTFSITKSWADRENIYGRRPSELRLRITRDGKALTASDFVQDVDSAPAVKITDKDGRELVLGADGVITVGSDSTPVTIRGLMRNQTRTEGDMSGASLGQMLQNDDNTLHLIGSGDSEGQRLQSDGGTYSFDIDGGGEILLYAIGAAEPGTPSLYEVEELSQPAGYTSTVTGNAQTGFTVMNTIVSPPTARNDVKWGGAGQTLTSDVLFTAGAGTLSYAFSNEDIAIDARENGRKVGRYTVNSSGTVTFTPDSDEYTGNPDPVTVTGRDTNGFTVYAEFTPHLVDNREAGTIRRIINYFYIRKGGMKAADSVEQRLTFTRVNEINPRTGAVLQYGGWRAVETVAEPVLMASAEGTATVALYGKMADVTSPSITGWTPDLARVPALDVTGPGADIVENVIYQTKSKLSISLEAVSVPKDGVNYKTGEAIVYRTAVTNNGDLPLYNVKVTDEITGLSRTVDVLQPGETKSYLSTYVVRENDVLAGTVKNKAHAVAADPVGEYVTADSSETYGDLTDEDTADVGTAGGTPHMSVIKSVASEPKDGKMYQVGEVISYLVTVINDGDITLRQIVVTDQFAGKSEVTLGTIESLEPGRTRGFVVTHTVDNTDIANGYVENTGSAKAPNPVDANAAALTGKSTATAVTAKAAATPSTTPSTTTPGTTNQPTTSKTTTKQTEKKSSGGSTSRSTEKPGDTSASGGTTPGLTNAAKTGDDTNLLFWLLLLGMSGMAAAVIGMMAVSRKRRRS